MIFTGVTIVFLPLSFMTSYYGMNLHGIQGTQKTETDFWKGCGSTALVIVFIVACVAFNHRIWSRIVWRNGPTRQIVSA